MALLTVVMAYNDLEDIEFPRVFVSCFKGFQSYPHLLT